jgi:hypothetical protein
MGDFREQHCVAQPPCRHLIVPAQMATLFTLTPSLLNPWSLSITNWFAGYAVVRAVLLVAVEGLVFLSSRVLPKLPTRTGPKPPYVHPLGRLDVLYLLINSFIEFVFVNQILWLLWYSPLASSSSQPRALCLPRVQPDRSVSLARRCCVPARRSRCSMAPPRSGCCSSQTTCCTRRRTG